jgi:1-aminocyclopropane-1-carboxylate deaminase/D-cysteine desulfhydrase-like pyridoxal-dependent ACC family enzyme
MLNRTLAALVVLAGSFATPGAVLRAQEAAAATNTVTDQDVQMLRQDLRSQKKQIIAANMGLTDAEAVKFWPLYDQYTAETIKLNDTRYNIIKQYAQSYDTMTDAQADSLVKQSNALDESFVQLRGKYIPQFRKILPAKKTALFFQLDRRIGLLIDLQLASMVPLVKQAQ